MRSPRIHELPDQEKPREKLLHRGVDSLTDAEILAILLRTGIPGCNVIDLAQKLLHSCGTLALLARCPVAELSNFKGIGAAKAVQLVAAFALGARLARIANSTCAPYSLLHQAYQRGVPVTVHVAIGTDTPHTHPAADGYEMIVRTDPV